MLIQTNDLCRYFLILGDSDKGPDYRLVIFKIVDPYDKADFDEYHPIQEFSEPLWTDDQCEVMEWAVKD